MACTSCNDTGLVEASVGEYFLLEREMLTRYGWTEFPPLRKPCDACRRALEQSLMSSAWRMLTTAWASVRDLNPK
ncbi:MAG TPA: hypothetical protein VIV11_32115 [Kofleriaceae bacterium]